MTLTFQELKRKIGFAPAVVLMEKQMPKEFWDNLTFDNWLEIWKNAISGSDLHKKAFSMACETANEIYQLFMVWENCLAGSDQRKTAFLKVCETAVDFHSWVGICIKTEQGSDEHYTAISMMRDKAVNFEQWLIVCMNAPRGSAIKKANFARLCETAATFDQWFKIWKYLQRTEKTVFGEICSFANDFKAIKTAADVVHLFLLKLWQRSDEEKIAFGKMCEIANGFEHWYEIWYYAKGIEAKIAFIKATKTAVSFVQLYGLWINSHYDKIVFEKICEINPSFEEWFMIWTESKKSYQVSTAFYKLLETAENFSQWIYFYRNIRDESAQKIVIYKKLIALANNFGQCAELLEQEAPAQERDLQQTLLLKMLSYEATVDECIRAWDRINQINPKSDLLKDVLIKMQNTVGQVSQN